MDYLKSRGDIRTKFTSVLLWLSENNYHDFIAFLENEWGKQRQLIETILGENFLMVWCYQDLIPYVYRNELDVDLFHFLSMKGVRVFKFNNRNYVIPTNNFELKINDFLNIYKTQFKQGENYFLDIVRLSYIFEKIVIRSRNHIRFV
jgi:hypothetical protein